MQFVNNYNNYSLICDITVLILFGLRFKIENYIRRAVYGIEYEYINSHRIIQALRIQLLRLEPLFLIYCVFYLLFF